MSYCRSITLIITLCLSLMACVSHNTALEEGIKCFRAQDYRSAFIRLKPLAHSGSPDAQYAVGYMYYYGEGVTENRRKAMYWIKCAAKKGQTEAVQALKILLK